MNSFSYIFTDEDVEQQRQHQREQARLQRHHEMAEKDAEFFDMMAAIDFFVSIL